MNENSDVDGDNIAEEESSLNQQHQQLQLAAQLREGGRSLLASLSLLLEEEKHHQQKHRQQQHQQQQQQQNNNHCVSTTQNNEAAVVVASLSDEKENARNNNAIQLSAAAAAVSAPPNNQRKEEDGQQSASLIPSNSNAIVVAKNHRHGMTEPIVSVPTFTTTANTINNTTTTNSNTDPNDPLTAKLHPPPQHYLRHVVTPPTEPRQYIDWKFHDMKLLIASDAVIYKHGESGDADSNIHCGTRNHHDDNTNNNNNNNNEEEETATATTTMAESIAIRVADASHLKSQMEYHQNMIKEQRRGLLVDHRRHNRSRSSRRALPPSSYAEALLAPQDTTEEEAGLKYDKTAKGLTEEGEEDDVDYEMGEDTNNMVKLKTCIVPSSGVGPELTRLGFSLSPSPPPNPFITDDINATVTGGGNVAAAGGGEGGGTTTECSSSNNSTNNNNLQFSSSPVCTVLDAYLDNIMTNVPQLALILREHGFVQNIKLLRTEDIPSLMMHPSTLGVGSGGGGGADESPSSNHATTPTASAAAAAAASSSAHPPVFSPDIVEMNAAMLLRFLKSNCTRENSTYLLHRAAGENSNIQLFDITSISGLRQRKWVWWLALCSYRFACRLEQLQTNVLSPHDRVTRREYRVRQRSLLFNTLNLLEELADMDGGGRHDTIGAAVCEHLADTYLWNDGDVGVRDASKPVPCASSSQPYPKVTVDCLNKAHDHLMNGIKKLAPLLLKAKRDKSPIMEIEAISTQLYGIHHKIVNVNLRLADHHYQSYYSSNLIQSLRTAARMLSDATSLLEPLNIFECGGGAENTDSNLYARSILLQYAWLWEYCGHYARSFAADDLWRDRGHTCGADLIGLFREVNHSCSSIMRQCLGTAKKWKSKTSVGVASHGQVSLNSLSGIVILPQDFEQIEASVLQKEGCHEAIGAAKSILDQKTQIKRDARLVLVAACFCYGHAIDSYIFLAGQNEEKDNDTNEAPPTAASGLSTRAKDSLISTTPPTGATIAPLLRQRLGDACNEIGKILLNESRAVLLPQFSHNDKKGITKNERFGISHVSAIFLASAQFWFLEGLEQFTEGKDLRNLALLRCNLCQCCKIRANTNVILPGTSADNSRNKSESYLQEAVDHLVSAHDAMGQRDADPLTWDMVSEELAATLLVLGVRRRQSALSSSSEPLVFQALRLTPGVENNIVEPMERSSKIYESLGTARASHQAAAAHYQLALYFSKVWTCQRDEVKTREKLAAAFKHYGLAHQYFFQHIQGNETTFVVLSLDFSNLYSAVSGEECLYKALLCCLDTRKAFSLQVEPTAMEQMTTLADNVEARVSKLLLNLVKIEKENNSKLQTGLKHSDKYKNMYRKALGHKMMSKLDVKTNNQKDDDENPPSIHHLLKALSEDLV
ncbi:hypothetical protein ACHAXR_007343 [Thalassiosira sp. AJA248-18]